MSAAQPMPHDDAKIVLIFETTKRNVEKVHETNLFHIVALIVRLGVYASGDDQPSGESRGCC
jgi:hypothetical protein